jgi:hypothetical protein
VKVISIWQPWASLIIHGHKLIETRGWPAPTSLIGQRIGIAATARLTSKQRVVSGSLSFRNHYIETGLLSLEELPLGCLLGTVRLHSCHLIDKNELSKLTDKEQTFGWYEIGRYAWHLVEPRVLAKPTPVKGAQRLWEYSYEEAV